MAEQPKRESAAASPQHLRVMPPPGDSYTAPTPEGAIDPDAHLEWIRVDEIHSDPSYQRELTPRFVNKIASEFDRKIFGVIFASRRRDGSIWSTDGQHRLAALRQMGKGDAYAPVLVYDNLTIEQEAGQFYLPQVTRRQLWPADRIKARMMRGDPAAIELDRIVTGSGFRLNLEHGSTGSSKLLDCIGSIEKVRTTYGSDVLAKTLDILRDAWGTDEYKMVGTIVRGLGIFVARYYGRYERDRVVDVIGRLTPHRLDTRGRESADAIGARREDGVARAIFLLYNQGMRASIQLPEWGRGERAGRGLRHESRD